MTKAEHSSKFIPGPHPFGLSADYVDFTIGFPCTYGDLIQKIAEQQRPRVEGLPSEWIQRPLPDGMKFNTFPGWICSYAPNLGYYLIVRGSAWEKVSSLCGHFKNVECKQVGKAIRFRVLAMDGGLSAFDKLAGRLMCEAPRGSNGRIPETEYRVIAAEIDKAGYKPMDKDSLGGKPREALALWNQTHSKDGKARQTFLSVYNAPQFRRGLLRRLNRSQNAYRKVHPVA